MSTGTAWNRNLRLSAYFVAVCFVCLHGFGCAVTASEGDADQVDCEDGWTFDPTLLEFRPCNQHRSQQAQVGSGEDVGLAGSSGGTGIASPTATATSSTSSSATPSATTTGTSSATSTSTSSATSTATGTSTPSSTWSAGASGSSTSTASVTSSTTSTGTSTSTSTSTSSATSTATGTSTPSSTWSAGASGSSTSTASVTSSTTPTSSVTSSATATWSAGASASATPSSCPNGPLHCCDGQQDDGESDIDCGGPCSPCLNGFKCRANSDCFVDQRFVCANVTDRCTSLNVLGANETIATLRIGLQNVSFEDTRSQAWRASFRNQIADVAGVDVSRVTIVEIAFVDLQRVLGAFTQRLSDNKHQNVRPLGHAVSFAGHPRRMTVGDGPGSLQVRVHIATTGEEMAGALADRLNADNGTRLIESLNQALPGIIVVSAPIAATAVVPPSQSAPGGGYIAPTPSPSPAPHGGGGGGGGGLSGGAVAGIVIGCMLGVGMAIAGAIFLRNRSKRSNDEVKDWGNVSGRRRTTWGNEHDAPALDDPEEPRSPTETELSASSPRRARVDRMQDDRI